MNKYFVLFFSIIVSVILAEVILRLHYSATYGKTLKDTYTIKTVARPYYTLGYLIRPSPYWKIVYELKPGLDVTFLGKGLKTNSGGWREKEFTQKQESFRIVGIGDSYMFGYGVDQEYRYMDVLEKKLGQKYNKTVQTFSLAVPGYNFVMEKEALDRYGMGLEPDIVIYEFVNNDFCLPNFIAPVRDFWSRESYILLYLEKLSGRGYDFMNTDDRGSLYEQICESDDAPGPYGELAGKDNFEAALSSFQDLKNITTPVMFVAIPSINDHEMTAWLDSLPAKFPGITFIYLEASTKYLNNDSFYDSDLVIGPGNYHYSEKGNRLVAEWLVEELDRRGLVS